MNVDYRHVLKVIALPFVLFLLIPFADTYYWQDMTLSIPERLCVYWLEHPAFTLRFLRLYAIPEILEIIFLVRWAVKPCLKTGIWLTIGTYFSLGVPLYFLVTVGGWLLR